MTSAPEGEEAPRDLILDSCQVLNLYATGRMPEILASLGRGVAVTDLTIAIEALWVGAGRLSDPSSDVEKVVLDSMIASGLLVVMALQTDAEYEAFVRLATVMDDGEAMAGAIAIERAMDVGTDDRKARTEFARLDPPLATVGTPEIIRHWATVAKIQDNELAKVLRDIRSRARFAPRASDRLADWWASAEKAEDV